MAEELKPIVLKFAERKVIGPQGQRGIVTQVVDSESGRPILGFLGANVGTLMGVRMMQLQVDRFEEERTEEPEKIAPSIILPTNGKMPPINGRFPR